MLTSEAAVPSKAPLSEAKQRRRGSCREASDVSITAYNRSTPREAAPPQKLAQASQAKTDGYCQPGGKLYAAVTQISLYISLYKCSTK